MKAEKKTLLVFVLFLIIMNFFSVKVSASNRPVGDTFVYDELLYKVVKAGTPYSIGEVQIIGSAGAGTSVSVWDTVYARDEEYNSENFTVVSFAPEAFKNNNNIRYVSVHESTHVTVIPKNCFENCKNMTAVYLYEITTIEDGAFYGCSRLKTLGVYDDTLKRIGRNAFRNCKRLNYFTIHDSKMKYVGKNAFKNTKSGFTIYTRYKKNYNLLKKSGGIKKLKLYQLK